MIIKEKNVFTNFAIYKILFTILIIRIETIKTIQHSAILELDPTPDHALPTAPTSSAPSSSLSLLYLVAPFASTAPTCLLPPPAPVDFFR
jgi:hypothetical protein